MIFEVAFSGRKLGPRWSSVEGCEIGCFRAHGGKAREFGNDERMNVVLQRPHNLTNHFVRGNDITKNTRPRYITNKIHYITENITFTSGTEVAIAQLNRG